MRITSKASAFERSIMTWCGDNKKKSLLGDWKMLTKLRKNEVNGEKTVCHCFPATACSSSACVIKKCFGTLVTKSAEKSCQVNIKAEWKSRYCQKRLFA